MEMDRFRKSVRLSEDARESLLSRLDELAHMVEGRQRRECPRNTYRAPNIAITVTHPGGGTVRRLVCTRNLSAGGLGFLYGGFLHRGTEVRIMLRTMHGEVMAVLGQVAMARHIEDDVHEIGVVFQEKIDSELFTVSALHEAMSDVDLGMSLPTICAKVLYLNDDKAEQAWLSHCLMSCGASPTIVDHPSALIEQARRLKSDIVVIDLDAYLHANPISSLRAAGYNGLVLGLSACASTPESLELETAFDMTVMEKPHDPVTLIESIGQLVDTKGASRRAPIYSACGHHPDMVEMIRRYIVHVQSTTRTYTQSMIRKGRGVVTKRADTDLHTMCRMLRTTAAGYGYPRLSEAARRVSSTVGASTSSIENGAVEIERLKSVVERLQITRPSS